VSDGTISTKPPASGFRIRHVLSGTTAYYSTGVNFANNLMATFLQLRENNDFQNWWTREITKGTFDATFNVFAPRFLQIEYFDKATGKWVELGDST